MKARTMVFAILVLCAAPALAQFNKCVGKDGKVVYTDGRCPAGAKADPNVKAEDPVTLPELSWDRQIFARWCIERWNNEASPRARGDMALDLRRQAEAGGERVRENLRRAGLTMEQAVLQQIEEDVSSKFNTDCLHFGFRRVAAQTDQYNERISGTLKQLLDTKYPDSKEKFERAKR